MLANHRLAQAISDAAYGELARVLAYKQQWRGGEMVRVDRWFPSSRTCADCRAVCRDLSLAGRVFVCGRCGRFRDRDLNAAIILAIWAEEHHARVRDPHAAARSSMPTEDKALTRTHVRVKPAPKT